VTAESDVSTVVHLVSAGTGDLDARPVLLVGAGPGDPGTAPGEVLLVGAGPGHPDLLTLDAEAALHGAREVVADRSLASLLEAQVAEAELRAAAGVEPGQLGVQPDLAAVGVGVDTEQAHGGDRPEVGETAGAVPVSWVDDDEPASADLLAAVRRGPGVVRLYRGDPWFHPAGDAERAALRTDGRRFELVPGVVEELAVLAAVGIPVQVRTLAIATTFVVHDPLGSAGESPRSALLGVGRTVPAGTAGETAGSTLPGVGRTATAGSANRSGRSTSDKPRAVVEAPVVPADAAHTLVVRTTNMVATARWLADDADPTGFVLDRPAAAVVTGPGDRQPAVAIRATLATLAERAPAQSGVVVVGLVAALDTTKVRPSVAGHLPRSAGGHGRDRALATSRTESTRSARETGPEGVPGTRRGGETEVGGSACETGRERSPDTGRTEAVTPADRSAAATGPDRAPGTSRTGKPCSEGSVNAVREGSTERDRLGAGR